jgi:hypothetical protein
MKKNLKKKDKWEKTQRTRTFQEIKCIKQDREKIDGFETLCR